MISMLCSARPPSVHRILTRARRIDCCSTSLMIPNCDASMLVELESAPPLPDDPEPPDEPELLPPSAPASGELSIPLVTRLCTWSVLGSSILSITVVQRKRLNP